MRPPLPWRPSKLRLLVLAARSPGRELVRVHRQAHRAARLAPLEAGGGEDRVEALRPRPPASPRTSPGRPSPASPSFTGGPRTTAGRGAEVLDPRVGARADEHGVDRDVADRGARLQAHVLQRAGGGLGLTLAGERRGIGDHGVDGRGLRRVRAPRDAGRESTWRRCDFLVERSRRRRSAAPARRRAPASHAVPFGANGRPSRYANVVSSGAISPARAPASIDMLQTVMRPSIESAEIAAPAVLDHRADAAAGADRGR